MKGMLNFITAGISIGIGLVADKLRVVLIIIGIANIIWGIWLERSKLKKEKKE